MTIEDPGWPGDDLRPCICADPEQCREAIPGYFCRRGSIGSPLASPERPRVDLTPFWIIHSRMMAFATETPSGQQTRQKSAREMVEVFAYELKDVIERAAVGQPALSES